MRIDEITNILNKCFSLNINPRGDLSDYYDVLKTLRLREHHITKELLIERIRNYKIIEIEELIKEL